MKKTGDGEDKQALLLVGFRVLGVSDFRVLGLGIRDLRGLGG